MLICFTYYDRHLSKLKFRMKEVSRLPNKFNIKAVVYDACITNQETEICKKDLLCKFTNKFYEIVLPFSDIFPSAPCY